MKKLKIYLDTSTISHLEAFDVPEKMSDTHKLWDLLKAGIHNIFISPTVITELMDCPEVKRIKLFEHLKDLEYTILDETEEVRILAQAYLDSSILRPRCVADSKHIAHAVVENCDVIVSWNFKDLVNVKTINGVRSVNAVNNYKAIDIVSPPSVSVEEVPNE